MIGLLLAMSALVPALLLLWFLYTRDQNPEPFGMVLRTFFLGAVICIPVVPIELLLGVPVKSVHVPGVQPILNGFFVAAVPEELFKLLVLRWAMKKPAFDEPMDGMVYGATASLGFAALENLLYVGGGGFGIAALRAFTAVPLHALTGVVMGAHAGRARFATDPAAASRLMWTGVLAAIAFHGAYDACLLSHSPAALLGLVILVVEAFWARSLWTRLRDEQVVLPPTATATVTVADTVTVTDTVTATDTVTTTVTASVTATATVPIPSLLPPPRPRRTTWGVLKLVLGAVAASLLSSAILLISLATMVGDPPLAVRDALVASGVIAVPLLLSILLFWSGLGGPFLPVPSPTFDTSTPGR